MVSGLSSGRQGTCNPILSDGGGDSLCSLTWEVLICTCYDVGSLQGCFFQERAGRAQCAPQRPLKNFCNILRSWGLLVLIPSCRFLGCGLRGWVPLWLQLHVLYFQGASGQVDGCDSLLTFPVFLPEASNALWEPSPG